MWITLFLYGESYSLQPYNLEVKMNFEEQEKKAHRFLAVVAFIIFAVIILYFVVVKGKDTTEELTPAQL